MVPVEFLKRVWSTVNREFQAALGLPVPIDIGRLRGRSDDLEADGLTNKRRTLGAKLVGIRRVGWEVDFRDTGLSKTRNSGLERCLDRPCWVVLKDIVLSLVGVG